MTTATFLKPYRTRAAIDAALGHYRWLAQLGTDVELPRLLRHTATAIEFEYIPGRTARTNDLPIVATALGRMHRAARRHQLARAAVNSPYRTASGLTISAFAAPRRLRLHAVLNQAPPPHSPLSHASVDWWLDHAARLPTALYKDANPRNVLLSPNRGPVLLDFDSLTLAPVGYDLAKLLVTTAMTDGQLPRSAVEEARTAYTQALGAGPAMCDLRDIVVWCEFHHLLTHTYLGRHGYRHPWPTVRPWSATEAHDAVSTVTTERA